MELALSHWTRMHELEGIGVGNLTEKLDEYIYACVCMCVCVCVCVCVCGLSTVAAFLIRGLIRSSVNGSMNKPVEVLQTRPVYRSSL